MSSKCCPLDWNDATLAYQDLAGLTRHYATLVNEIHSLRRMAGQPETGQECEGDLMRYVPGLAIQSVAI